MAKTQNDIVKNLITALQNGKGNLDDLDILMDSVKQDIIAAKEAEAKAAKEQADAELLKHGEEIAAMATRVLEEKTTAADLAMVFQSFMRANGHKDVVISAEEIEESMDAAEEMTKHISSFVDALDDLFGFLPDKEPAQQVHKNVAAPTKERTADDILNDFLRTLK